MKNQTFETLVGAVVLTVALVFGLYAAQVAKIGGAGVGYDLTASFRSVEGISVGTDVRLAGVKVGSVSGLTLNSETYRADAVLALTDQAQIPDDSAAVISSEGLLGGNFVEIVPGGSPFYLADGDEIVDTQGSVSLISLLLKFVSGGDGD